MQSGDIVTINSRKYDGTIRRSWTCRFISWEASLLVFAGEFEFDVSHPDLGLIVAGTRSVEYYWLDRCYNVFRFFEPTGEFRNLYCNINMPPTFENGVLDYVDLDIDVVAWPDGMTNVLDEDNFEANAERYDYPESVRTAALEALEEIRLLISTGRDVFSPS